MATKTKTKGRKPTAAQREAAKAKVAGLHDKLAAGIAELTSTEQWTAWLDMASKFHDYSFGNVMLILSQRPDASQVAGYRKWQELGRQVRKGEQAISILAPRTGRCYTCNGEGDGCTRCGGSGRVLWFAAASVFDVSQTDGDPLPEAPVARLTGDDEHGWFARIVDRLLPEGWTVTLEAIPGETNGYCAHGEQKIVVDADLDPAAQVKTLVHELAHAAMHAPADVDYSKDRGRCEVEAESVAYILLGALDIDAADYSFGYVASWADGDLDVVEATGRAVSKQAKLMLDGLLDDDAA